MKIWLEIKNPNNPSGMPITFEKDISGQENYRNIYKGLMDYLIKDLSGSLIQEKARELGFNQKGPDVVVSLSPSENPTKMGSSLEDFCLLEVQDNNGDFSCHALPPTGGLIKTDVLADQTGYFDSSLPFGCLEVSIYKNRIRKDETAFILYIDSHSDGDGIFAEKIYKTLEEAEAAFENIMATESGHHMGSEILKKIGL